MLHARLWSAFAATALLLAVASSAQATLIAGWGAETGFANGTLTDGPGAGTFSTTVPTGNLGARALLPSAISLANVGDGIQLTGTVTLSGAPGNQQFRFGLFNSNGH